MNLSESIKHARKELGLTQTRLAELSNVQRRQISTLERGGNVTLRTVSRVLPHLPNLRDFTLQNVAVNVDHGGEHREPPTDLTRNILAAASLLLASLKTSLD